MLTLLLVDDQPAVLDALRQCFALEADIRIVGKAENGLEAIEMARDLRPDMVLLDLNMPAMDGLQATRALREAVPGLKVVVLSIHDDPAMRASAFAAGADAFISKHDGVEVLLSAIRRAAPAL